MAYAIIGKSFKGPCYCKHKFGYPDKSQIICLNDESYDTFDPCLTNEYCTGPTTPEKSELFSRQMFCSKGASSIVHRNNN